MSTREIKAQIHKSADRVERGVAAAAANLGNGVEALGEERDRLGDNVEDAGQHLLDSCRTLTGAAADRARLHRLAAFGVAFVAGLIVARALRR